MSTETGEKIRKGIGVIPGVSAQVQAWNEDDGYKLLEVSGNGEVELPDTEINKILIRIQIRLDSKKKSRITVVAVRTTDSDNGVTRKLASPNRRSDDAFSFHRISVGFKDGQPVFGKNSLNVLWVNDEGTLFVEEVALISQHGKFFLISQRTYSAPLVYKIEEMQVGLVSLEHAFDDETDSGGFKEARRSCYLPLGIENLFEKSFPGLIQQDWFQRSFRGLRVARYDGRKVKKYLPNMDEKHLPEGTLRVIHRSPAGGFGFAKGRIDGKVRDIRIETANVLQNGHTPILLEPGEFYEANIVPMDGEYAKSIRSNLPFMALNAVPIDPPC